MPIVSTTRMTAHQYLQLGEDPPGVRLELVDGEIAVAPSPTPEHSNADGQLRFILQNHVDANDLGLILADLDTPLDMFNVRRPDILYFSKPRLHLVTRKVLTGPPDLCIEIVSPSSSTIDRVDKFDQYRNAGVAYYWILDPIAHSLEGFRLHRGNYESAGEGRDRAIVSLPPFPKLKIPLTKLWWPISALPDRPSPRRRPRGDSR